MNARILNVVVNNRTGVLNRITGLFLKRGFNIQSLTVSPSEIDGQSRMTIVLATGDERIVEQVIKQLSKQIDVLKVQDITDQPIVARELVLIRVHSPIPTRAELTSLIEPFRASVIDVGRDSVTIEATGKPEKIDALLALLRPYGIKELARTGLTSMTRDSETVQEIARFAKSNALWV
ncbi:acetolactate synthase small subunit [Alicyclobacillus kakegawensis]|uniref:acetolactate synthase small subunit n=1 Tax=Alicyclobacillus kakegawensis TaxID=392012 RepID=UPI0008368407|nr:acetolactate synthase small subunit [Alicyclobacillus kakegawensis]